MTGDIEGMRKALEKIRASPGGRAVSFAKIAGAVFEEIESLRSERFKLTDICKALEAGGYLPEGSNPGALSKALCRERKKRVSRSPGTRGVKKQGAGEVYTPEYSAGGVTAPRLRPDNTFDIEPIDLDGLPEL
jgi:hypothetical protein